MFSASRFLEKMLSAAAYRLKSRNQQSQLKQEKKRRQNKKIFLVKLADQDFEQQREQSIRASEGGGQE